MGSAFSISCLKSLILASGGRSGKGSVGFMSGIDKTCFLKKSDALYICSGVIEIEAKGSLIFWMPRSVEGPTIVGRSCALDLQSLDQIQWSWRRC